MGKRAAVKSEPEPAEETTKQKVPKAVKCARAELEKVGQGITGANLKSHLSKEQYARLTAAIHDAMSPRQKEDWKSLENDVQRRDWMASFVTDPVDFKGKAINKSTAINSKIDKSADQWLTEAQIAGPMYLNDVAAAKLLVDSTELRERPHEYQGYYHHTNNEHNKSNGLFEPSERPLCNGP